MRSDFKFRGPVPNLTSLKGRSHYVRCRTVRHRRAAWRRTASYGVVCAGSWTFQHYLCTT